MAPILQSAYQELEEMFEILKKITVRPTGSKDAHEKAVFTLNEQFNKMISRIDELLQTVTREEDIADWLKLTVMKSSLIYEQGKVNMREEKFEEAKESMKRSLKLLSGIESDPKVLYLHMRIMNHLGFIFSKLEQFGAAKNLLTELIAIEVPANAIAFTTGELFTINGINSEDGPKKMHQIFLNNLQLLSWIYGKLGYERESAKVQHTILEKEMDFEECDPVDWAMRCTRVASMYLVRKQFVAARYYLSATTSALERAECRLVNHPELGKAQAELARGWIYYGLKLFDVSRGKDINQMCSEAFDDADPTIPQDYTVAQEEEPEEYVQFQNSEVAIAKVPARPIQKVIEARMLFQHTQIWLKRARIFYTLRDYPFIYVNCVLDLSELYRFLAFYEPDLETQYAVHRKRANSLETLSTVLKEVRPQCYIAVSVDLLRDLAEVQIELLRINLKRMYKIQNEANENGETVIKHMENVYQIHHKLESIGNYLHQPYQQVTKDVGCQEMPEENKTPRDSSVSGVESTQI